MDAKHAYQPKQPKEFEEKVIEIKRLSKKTKGGNKISFSALVVIGDGKGRAGVGLSKAKDVLTSIQKSIRQAKRNLTTVNLINGTIPHQIWYEKGAATILMKPAPDGTGVIAGGAVRAVAEAFGIKNIVSKTMGTANKTANVFATFDALKSMKVVEKPVKKIETVVEDKQEKQAEAKSEEKKPVAKKVVKKATATQSKSKKS